eukprot:s2861_g1.t2
MPARCIAGRSLARSIGEEDGRAHLNCTWSSEGENAFALRWRCLRHAVEARALRWRLQRERHRAESMQYELQLRNRYTSDLERRLEAAQAELTLLRAPTDGAGERPCDSPTKRRLKASKSMPRFSSPSDAKSSEAAPAMTHAKSLGVCTDARDQPDSPTKRRLKASRSVPRFAPSTPTDASPKPTGGAENQSPPNDQLRALREAQCALRGENLELKQEAAKRERYIAALAADNAASEVRVAALKHESSVKDAMLACLRKEAWQPPEACDEELEKLLAAVATPLLEAMQTPPTAPVSAPLSIAAPPTVMARRPPACFTSMTPMAVQRDNICKESWLRGQSRLTFASLDTFCALVKQPLPVVLERFGGFFVQHVAEEGYLTFLKSLGGNLFQFLSNINILHHTIERDSKAAVFPLFSVKHLDGDPKSEHHVFLLTYGSMRPGLTPFLTGVLTKASFLLFNCTVDIQDVTDSFPPEMGKDVLVQSSFRVAASRVGGWSTSESKPKQVDEFTSKGSFFDFHKMLSAMWRCDCSGGSQDWAWAEGFNVTQLDRVPVQDMEPEVWAVIMEKQDKIEEILRAYDGIDAGVNVVPRMTGGDRMRLAAVLFRGIAAGSVSASWTEAARLQDMGEFWATNSVSFGDKFRESKDWFTNGQKSIVAARRTHGEILFVSHCWSAPREWGFATAGKQAKAAETWHPPEFSPSGAESPPQTSDVLVSAEELCLHAKQVAGDKDWKKVGFWIDKACIPQSDPGLMSWCVNLLEEFIALSDGMVVLASWNYFNRLWCVYEWVCGLLIHDVMEIEILADPFVRDSTVDLYLECIRNFSIASCEILIDKVNTYYKSVEDFERFFQFTVIACFIRCMARRRTARAGASLQPWIDLATACGFSALAEKDWCCGPCDFFEEEILPLIEKERETAGNHLGLTYAKGLQELAEDAKQSQRQLGDWVNEIAMIGQPVVHAPKARLSAGPTSDFNVRGRCGIDEQYGQRVVPSEPVHSARGAERTFPQREQGEPRIPSQLTWPEQGGVAGVCEMKASVRPERPTPESHPTLFRALDKAERVEGALQRVSHCPLPAAAKLRRLVAAAAGLFDSLGLDAGGKAAEQLCSTDPHPKQPFRSTRRRMRSIFKRSRGSSRLSDVVATSPRRWSSNVRFGREPGVAVRASSVYRTLSYLDSPGRQVWLLGTAHVSKVSAAEVKKIADESNPDLIFVELCDGRLRELKARMGNTEVPSLAEALSNIKTGSGPLMDRIFRTLLKAQQAAIAKIFDLRPGAEFFAAIEVAEQRNLPLVCGDRDVDETMHDLKEAFLKDWWSLLTSSSQVLGT